MSAGPFRPAVATFRGRLQVGARIEDVFPLFSPEGERRWVPGWDPELLHPPGATWEEGQIFRTREERGEAVWVVTRLDRTERSVEYHRVEDRRCVARVRVRCARLGTDRTDVVTEYTFVGLSEEGNAEIAAMTDEAYDAKMARWGDWIRKHLAESGGARGPRG